jgi:hypothetical protein
MCYMEPAAAADGNRDPAGRAERSAPPWPGPYEAQCLLEGLSGIARDCRVDWEVWDPYGPRPIGIIRDGVCHSDAEAIAEAARKHNEALLRRMRR